MTPSPLDALRAKALRRWARTDPRIAQVAREAPPYVRPVAAGTAFEALASSITHQQVSLASGRAIWTRLVAAAGGEATPDAIVRLDEASLRGVGLSRAKASYIGDLARRCVEGSLDLDGLADLEDDAAIEALTSVKGVGVWTAKMHLIFHLERPDVLPHEDLGVQIAVAQAYDVPREKAVAKMLALRSAWSPYCTLATLSLWSWRRAH